MTIKRPLGRVILIASVVALFSLALYANHSWGGYHWARTSNPFTVKLGDNVTSVWDSYLRSAAGDWNSSRVLDTSVVAGGVSRNVKKCSITPGRVEVCNSTYGFNGWLGVAGIQIQGSHITGGYVKMNDSYFNTAQYNTAPWRNLVMCQEIGHTFGLDHQDENFSNTPLGTCMDYSNDPVPNQHPNTHDYDELETIYSHLDSTTTVGQSTNAGVPQAMRDLDFEGPGQWGRLVSQSRDGGKSVYEMDFGNGHKMFTFVTWTVETAAQRRARD
jgi:hypothetical protein